MATHLIVGLGNPGAQYEQTRHNIGWLAIDQLADDLGISLSLKSPMEAFIGQGFHQGNKLFLIKPTTYMNLSGRSVSKICSYYKIPPEKVIVLSDDFHLDFGRLRLRGKGSSGGQKGLQNIIDCLGTPEIARLRMGVGPVPGRQQGKNFVLKPFPNKEWQDLPFVLDRCVKGVLSWIDQGLEQAMQVCNGPLDLER